MNNDIVVFQRENPNSYLKRKGDYTQKFKKWMRQRVKTGKTNILWTEPNKIYNENTDRFINKDSRIIKKLKKNLIRGSRIIKDYWGVVTFDIEYQVVKKNSNTGLFYDDIYNIEVSLVAKTKKSTLKSEVDKTIDQEIDRALKESGWYIKGERPIPRNLIFIKNDKAKKLKNTPMKNTGMIDLDGEMKNADWCRNRGMCVYDFLHYRYGDVKRFKKITTDEKMTEIFKCDIAGISMYCLFRIFLYHKPLKNNKQS